MSELPMRGHFRYLRFKTFSTTPRTLQCKVFFPLLSSSEHLGVPEDSNSQLFQVLGFTPTLGQSRGATSAMYCKSMALYSYFGSRVYIHLESLWAAKKKSMSKFQILQCKKVCNPWVSNTLTVYLNFLPLLDFFLECFFQVFFGGGFIQREIIQTVKNLR
jgi:hypothetical protein